MSKETVGTIGSKRNYYALRADMTEAGYQVTEGLLPPPAYFGMNVARISKAMTSKPF
jgi:hypothetical protein